MCISQLWVFVLILRQYKKSHLDLMLHCYKIKKLILKKGKMFAHYQKRYEFKYQHHAPSIDS